MDDFQRCHVLVLHPKPKIYNAKYYPEDMCGNYKRSAFAIPHGVQPFITEKPSKREKPIFVVDPKTSLAQPVGVSTLNIIENWIMSETNREGKIAKKCRLQVALEVAMQKRYVKAMTLKVFDLVQTLIIMGAGGGVILYTLHLISAFTGNPITL